MNINGLFPRWRVVALGAINGLIFSLIVKVAMRIDYEYSQRELAVLASRTGTYIDITENPFKWWVIPSACIILFSLSSYVVHLIYARRIKSPIVLWGIVGLASGGVPFLAGYFNNLISLLMFNIEDYQAECTWVQLADFFSIHRLEITLFALAVLVGLLYGTIIRFALAQYVGKGKV